MFGKIITRGRNSGLKCLSTGSLPPPPFPFPFLAIFFPKQRACSQANSRKLSSWFVWLNIHVEKERNNYISLFPELLVLNIASHIWKIYTSQIKMKKIYILYYPSPSPPSFPRPWDICLQLSYLQPPLSKNPASAPVKVKARSRHACTTRFPCLRSRICAYLITTTQEDTLGFVLVNFCSVLYVTVSVRFKAHFACNLSIGHAKHACNWLLTTTKDYKNKMAWRCVFSEMNRNWWLQKSITLK